MTAMFVSEAKTVTIYQQYALKKSKSLKTFGRVVSEMNILKMFTTTTDDRQRRTQSDCIS